LNIIIIIPCFNDNEPIKKLISQLIELCDLNILVIDDGSDSHINISSFGDRVAIIRNESNKGKGYSLRMGFEYALSNNYTHAITIDADMQHDPNCINKFIEISDNFNMVIGMRSFGTNMPIHRRFSNNVTSMIISLMCRKRIKDSQSGYRRYELKSSAFNGCTEDGFQFESEILIDQLKADNALVQHVSIPTLYNDEKSSINNASDTYKFIKLIVRKIFAR